jgi:hypothetical protein
MSLLGLGETGIVGFGPLGTPGIHKTEAGSCKLELKLFSSELPYRR